MKKTFFFYKLNKCILIIVNKKDTVKKILFLSLILALVSGCLNYIQDVNLYPDGSGKMKINYWMKTPDSSSIKTIGKIGIFNEDTIKSEFSSPFTKIKEVRVYADSTDSTMHSIIDLSFTHIDSLNKTKAFADAHFSFKDGAAGQKVFSQFIPPIATGWGIDGSNFRIQYKYTFSGEVVQHNAHNQENKTLIWNYNLSELGSGKTISVSFIPYKIKETPYWIYMISGAVLIIVIIFLFKKKKD
jgi:hypothetical protein